MVSQPPGRERAVWHQSETVVAGLVDRGAHQIPTDPMAGQCLGHSGVHQQEAPARPPIHKLGLLSVLNQDESVMGDVINCVR
jgi:hypothetical protein